MADELPVVAHNEFWLSKLQTRIREFPAAAQHHLRRFIALQADHATATARIAELKADNENLRSVMIAAAEEIQEHWDAHCDSDGYGPANLMYRLEKGIPSEYAYKVGDFTRLRTEVEASKRHAAGCLDLVSRIRFALGDNGKRMQPELIEWCKTLADAPERFAKLCEIAGEEAADMYGDGAECLATAALCAEAIRAQKGASNAEG